MCLLLTVFDGLVAFLLLTVLCPEECCGPGFRFLVQCDLCFELV